LLTPAIVHRGQATMQVQARQKVLSPAYAAHPERFVRGHPMAPELPTAVWINPPATTPVSEPTAAPSYSSVRRTGLSGEGELSNAP